MTRLIAGLAFAFLAAVSTRAALPSGSDGAVFRALDRICIVATEQNKPVRALALSNGFTPESAVPARVRQNFPASTVLAASWSVNTPGGVIHVTSPVLAPPSTPFSCLVTSDADAPALIDLVAQTFEGHDHEYQVMSAPDAPGLTTLTLNRADPNGVNKILVIRILRPTDSQFRTTVLTYRVDKLSAGVAKNIDTLCTAGKMPRPEVFCKGAP